MNNYMTIPEIHEITRRLTAAQADRKQLQDENAMLRSNLAIASNTIAQQAEQLGKRPSNALLHAELDDLRRHNHDLQEQIKTLTSQPAQSTTTRSQTTLRDLKNARSLLVGSFNCTRDKLAEFAPNAHATITLLDYLIGQ